MKRLTILFISVAVLLAGCYPTTKITASWKSPQYAGKSYKTIFVAALTGNTIARSTLENDLSEALKGRQINTVKSIDEFPPTFSNDSVSKEVMMDAVKKKQSDAILTISILKKETESRYVSGGYAPMRYGWYGNFWGYYNYWYPYAYNEAYYIKDEIYYLESNLYDSNTETLIWSAQSQTYNFIDLTSFSKEFAKVITEKMIKDGVLK